MPKPSPIPGPVHFRRFCVLTAPSLVRDPLADVGRATPQFDAFRLRLCQKLNRVTADQLYLCEFDGDDSAWVERSANDLQIFRRDLTADVKDQTVFRRKSVDSARHWLASPAVH
jgi:hypothetical protein